MSKKKIGVALLVILQLGQLSWLGWLGWLQLTAINAGASSAELKAQVTGLTGELEALKLTQAELKLGLDKLQQTSSQIESINARILEVEQVARVINQSQRDTLELRVVLSAKLEQLTDDFVALKRSVSAPAPTMPASKPVAPQKKPPTPAKRVAKAKIKSQPAPPPFVLLGIETRAGEQFATVARSASTTLDEVQLLRAGEAYASWKLIRLDEMAAVFLAGGEERVMNLR